MMKITKVIVGCMVLLCILCIVPVMGEDVSSNPASIYSYVPTSLPEGTILVDVNDPTSTITVSENGIIQSDKFYKNYVVEGEIDGMIYRLIPPTSTIQYTDSNGYSSTSFAVSIVRDLGVTITATPEILEYPPEELILTLQKDSYGYDMITQVRLPFIDNTYSIPKINETDLVSGAWQVQVRYNESDFPGLSSEYLIHNTGILVIAPVVDSGCPERMDIIVESMNSEIPASVAIDLKPEDLPSLVVPDITRNGLSVALTDSVLVRYYTVWNGVTPPSYSAFLLNDVTLNGDTTLNFNGAYLSNADSVTVYFMGRVLGDATGDIVIDEEDSIKIANSLVGLGSLTDAELFYSDVSADGGVDVLDCIKIAQLLEGILDENYEKIRVTEIE